MKLSKAIRKGSETTKQIEGHFFQYEIGSDGKRIPIAACALGAASIGVGEKGSNAGCKLRQFPILRYSLNEFPEDLVNHEDIKYAIAIIYSIETTIIRLNDNYGWSREAIAMWIETLEDYLEEQETEVKITEEQKCQPALT